MTNGRRKAEERRQRGLYSGACQKVKWATAIRAARREIIIQFPLIPRETATQIARFASHPGSGRVFRHQRPNESTQPDQQAWKTKVPLAVAAHVRHTMTDYETLVWKMTRDNARDSIRPKVQAILAKWGFVQPSNPTQSQSQSESDHETA